MQQADGTVIIHCVHTDRGRTVREREITAPTKRSAQYQARRWFKSRGILPDWITKTTTGEWFQRWHYEESEQAR